MKLRVAKYILALLLPAVLLLPSCSDGLDLAQQPASLEVARTELDGGDGNLFLAIKARGKWTLSVEQGTAWLSLSTTVGSGDRNNVVIYYDANPRTEPRTGIIVLETEFQTVRIQLIQSGAVSSGGAPDSSFGFLQYAPQHWLELPQTSVADGYDFFYRSCSLGGVSARNYAFYWNYSDRVSMWVAYPLTNGSMGLRPVPAGFEAAERIRRLQDRQQSRHQLRSRTPVAFRRPYGQQGTECHDLLRHQHDSAG